MWMGLLVRSCSGRFVRISTNTRVNVRRAVQECEDALVHAREGHDMMATRIADDGQPQTSKGLQRSCHKWGKARPTGAGAPCAPTGPVTGYDHRYIPELGVGAQSWFLRCAAGNSAFDLILRRNRG